MGLRRKALLALFAAMVVSTGLAAPASAADRPVGIPESAITELKQLIRDNDTAYGGLAQYPDSKTLVVTLPEHGADPAAARSRISSLTGRMDTRAVAGETTWRVEYRTVERSLHQLAAVKEGVPTRQPFAGVAGDRLTRWYVDPRSNTVAIGVTSLDQDIVDAARTTYGETVTLHLAERPSPTVSRLSDASPWTSGLRITKSNGDFCTGGFAVYHRGVEYMLTAGHCGGIGTSWYNDGNLVGYTDIGFNGRGGWDSALIRGGNYHPSMFIGGVHSTTYRTVSGTYDPPIGGQICTSGSVSGASCQSVVTIEDTCITFTDNVTRCHLTIADFTGARSVNGGDSGGPVYANFGSNVRAVGQIIGSDSNSYAYHPIGGLLALYGAGLTTPSTDL